VSSGADEGVGAEVEEETAARAAAQAASVVSSGGAVGGRIVPAGTKPEDIVGVGVGGVYGCNGDEIALIAVVKWIVGSGVVM